MKAVSCLFAVILLSMTVRAQPPGIKIQDKKSWVSEIAFDKNAIPDAGEGAGYYYLLIDEQENVPLAESYVHYAYKILTTEGVQEVSDLSFGFDPAYTELVFHAVVIHRDGKTINKLTRDIRTIQQEQSMDRFLYDGSLTAVINLSDVRVGDIIEYSFTRKGYNPVYQGHYSRKIYFDYNLGYEKSFQRIILPAAMYTELKNVNTAVQPVVEEKNGLRSYTWSTGRTAGIMVDSNVPGWYNPYQHAMISNYKSWGEIARWAAGWFEVKDEEFNILAEKISEDFKEESKEAFVLKAIHFVQDEIRYLGFESGLNSHKPHAPSKIYQQRFGDCKDKSLLLATMLKSRGIEAYPVLVSTVLGGKISDQLPSVDAFNHCVVQLIYDGQTIYVDPTISNQGGTLKTYYFPIYGKGLVVDAATTGFVEFPPPRNSAVSEIQSFELTTIGGEAMLGIRTIYTGAEADRQRAEFAKNNIETFQKNYLSYYGNVYPDIEKFETLTTTDNRTENTFTVEEKYKIPGFWKPKEEQPDVIFCELYAQSLENYFNISKAASRTGPYELAYPVDYHHAMHVKFPEDWNVTPDEDIISTPYYSYEFNVAYADQEMSILTQYTTKQPSVPVNDFSAFVADHEKMMGHLGYYISYDKSVASMASSKWQGIVVTILTVALGVVLILLLYNRFDPRPYFTDRQAEPIGGWLILVAIGLTLSPFRIAYDMLSSPEVLSSESWMPFFATGQYGLFAFLLAEHVYNILFFLYTSVVVLLFYQRRSSVPLLMTIFYAISCVATIADTIVSVQIDPTVAQTEKNFYNEAVRSFVAALIWIPYFNMSSRVKETFVNTLNDHDDLESDNRQPVEAGEDLSQNSRLS
jgi:transglutaminase-like putative cysteine protease